MSSNPTPRTFRFVEVDDFDARRGFKRWFSPGVGVSYVNGPRAVADFWTDGTDTLFVRVASQGYVYHLEASRIDGKRVSEDDKTEFEEYVVDTLHEWIAEGMDEMREFR